MIGRTAPADRPDWASLQPFGARAVLVVLAAFDLLFYSGERMQVDRLVALTAKAVLADTRLAGDGEGARGLGSVLGRQVPLQISERQEVSRIDDRRPQEALAAIGAGRLALWRMVVLPQVMPHHIGSTPHVLDRNVRMATVIGLVVRAVSGRNSKAATTCTNTAMSARSFSPSSSSSCCSTDCQSDCDGVFFDPSLTTEQEPVRCR